MVLARLAAAGLLLGSLALLVPSRAAAQERFTVTGTVVDTTGAGLAGATVVVVQAADSALVSFGVARGDGAFLLRRVPSGAYLLQVTFVGYTPYSAPISVEGTSYDAGTITLKASVEGLDELVISAEHIPMVVKEDTLEYNAAAFGAPVNANVEELLRRLPGVEVDRDGTIKAQGETVQRVLVDGKEFFGNDPKVATRNLPADAVERVQVFDKQSDAAEFTGVEDGQQQKTINLELKQDRKHGYFGNVTGGVGGASMPGEDTRFDSRVSVSRFSPTTQLSLLGNFNNVNKQGFDFGEFISFMGGMGAMMGDDGFRISSELPIGTSLSDGYSTTLAGGGNFNHDFGQDTELRSNYFASYLDNDQARTVRQQQLFGEAVSSLARQRADQSSRNVSHRLSADVKHTLREGQDVRLRTTVRATSSDLGTDGFRETLSAGGGLENTSGTRYGSDNASLSGEASLTFRTRFSEGRSLVAEVEAQLEDGNGSGDLRARNVFYENGNVLTSEEIAQIQDRQSDQLTQAQTLTYTEPLGGQRFLQIELQHRAVQESQGRSVFDLDGAEQVRNDLLSSAFERTYRYLRGGLDLRQNGEGLSLGLGVDVQQSFLDGEVLERDAAIDKRYLYVLPSANLRYELAQGRHLNLRYRTSTREPSVRDLQPVIDNSDPLNVYVGNPGLRPEYAHSLSAGFMLFDQFTFTNFFAWVRAGYTSNKIARARTIDEQFRQTVTPINTDGDWMLTTNLDFGTPLRPLGVKVNVSNNTALNRGVEVVNGEENRSRIVRSTFGANLENRTKDRFDARVGASYTFNDVAYSLNERLDQRYANQSFYAELAWTPPGGWRVATKFDYTRYAGEVFGDGQNVPLWEAELSKMLFNDRLQVQLVALDLLDRNVGVTYTNTNTYIQEERVNALGRYAMLKLVYTLGKKRDDGGGGIRVFRSR